tara:strand:- start:3175 stop:3459 length:285 start_codon:yes stop_codon:yes gene_type:complete
VPPKQKAPWARRIEELIAHQLAPDTVLPPKQPARPVLSTELFYDNILKTPEDERVATALRAAKAIEKTEEAEPGARGGPTILIHFLTQSNRPPQ